MLRWAEPSLSVMIVREFGYCRIGLVSALMLLVAACAQPRIGQAPVINGGTGERVQQSPPAVATPGTVTVRRGDSLYKIAKRYRIRLRGIIDANNLKPPYTIFPGQKLKLPVSGVHVAARGETIYQIARRYGTEPGALVRINRIAPPYRVVPGQRIILPKDATQTAAQSTGVSRQTARTPATQTSPTGSKRQARQSGVRPAPRAVLPSERVVVKRAPRTSAAVKPPPPSRGGFIWPVSGRVLAKFGTLGKGLQNDGINILARRGTPVRAIQNGVVAYSGNELRGFGNLLLIKHSGGWISAYAHNDRLLVKTGQKVRRGQVISRVGSTGSVDRPQLHFELRRKNRAVDPERYLGRRTAHLSR